MTRLRVLLVFASLGVALALPLSVGAADRADDVRQTGTCSGSSEIGIRLRSDDDVIEVEVEIESPRRGSPWSVILLHERRIAFRRTLRTRGGGSIELRRSVPDWFGVDSFVVRAAGPRGESCRVSAAI